MKGKKITIQEILHIHNKFVTVKKSDMPWHQSRSSQMDLWGINLLKISLLVIFSLVSFAVMNGHDHKQLGE